MISILIGIVAKIILSNIFSKGIGVWGVTMASGISDYIAIAFDISSVCILMAGVKTSLHQRTIFLVRRATLVSAAVVILANLMSLQSNIFRLEF